jgi:hypothetical protein
MHNYLSATELPSEQVSRRPAPASSESSEKSLGNQQCSLGNPLNMGYYKRPRADEDPAKRRVRRKLFEDRQPAAPKEDRQPATTKKKGRQPAEDLTAAPGQRNKDILNEVIQDLQKEDSDFFNPPEGEPFCPPSQPIPGHYLEESYEDQIHQWLQYMDQEAQKNNQPPCPPCPPEEEPPASVPSLGATPVNPSLAPASPSTDPVAPASVDEEVEIHVSAPKGMTVLPLAVNARVVPLNLMRTKNLEIGVDLRGMEIYALFRGISKSKPTWLRVSVNELFALMKEDVFQKIKNCFLSRDEITFKVGGVEVKSLLLYEKNIIHMKREDSKFQGMFIAQSTWEQLGNLREVIKRTLELTYESVPFIRMYVEEMVQSAAYFVAFHHHEVTNYQHTEMPTFSLANLVRGGLYQCEPYIRQLYSQLKTINSSHDVPLLKEELIAWHFDYLYDRVRKELSKTMSLNEFCINVNKIE